jgi:predicted nucleic acid-binding protein
VSEPVLLIDTSVAVALLVSDHESHLATVEAVGHRSLGLAGHAAYETFSVLTRMPPPIRRTSQAVAQLLQQNFPESRFLSDQGAEALLSRLPQLRISGGAVYDALVAAASLEHQLSLATRDRRALETYRAIGVEVEILE